MKAPKPPSTRLWVIFAREAPVGVIFRRGPSRQVQLIKWHLDIDTFEYGQWFKGRIYERRCDLSPKGTLLIYFAATYKRPLFSWTAVSKPPWLTAVALWPKGDGWNGGGRFLDDYSIHLDHGPGDEAPHPDFVSGCRKLRIVSLARQRGEDAPVWHANLERGGWVCVSDGVWGEYGDTKEFSWKALAPEIWQKPHPQSALMLQMLIEGISQDNGPWYVVRHRVVDKSQSTVLDLGLNDWAEWDAQGNLLFAKDGCLYRQTFRRCQPQPPTRLGDFRNLKFQSVKAPAWAASF
jgi:hypothetical protein